MNSKKARKAKVRNAILNTLTLPFEGIKMASHPMERWHRVFMAIDTAWEGPDPTAKGFAEFELDFEHALMRQLGPYFDLLAPLELTPENIESAVEAKARGAYYLLLGDRIVYIGKSDAKAGLQQRLLRHYKTLKRRKGIDWSEMKFKAVKVASLAALDTESLLLQLFQKMGEIEGSSTRPEWNQSGFGSNDPGVERDTQRVSIFDQKYPLDLDAIIDLPDIDLEDTLSLAKYLDWLKKQLKFTFRIQKRNIPGASKLEKVQVSFPQMTQSARLKDLLLKIHQALPEGWILTVLRGKVVLYVNDERPYKSPLWRLIACSPVSGGPNYDLGDVGNPEATKEDVDEENDD
ncbi:hypothetical protein OU995_05300 [Roseateles sp. SL47]|uniref:hypothetical protein n=1 Tax=Roseateles sp. SL47 TaxID=2995138 RepID=UPI00226FA3B7|nr:hypothetical protein [Roseateles sp. SL47]WAC74144.1 hypothetical protein OU995_05300 [Roseateles sp. SL47]